MTVLKSSPDFVPGTGHIQTKEMFGDCQLHIEWNAPIKDVREGKKGQGAGNSGIFLMSHFELQVLNSYNNKTNPKGQAGAIYNQHPPLVNASMAPRQLIDSAHQAGIKDVFVWDRAFYPLSYYPEKYLIETDNGQSINLDDPEFWKWFRNDYREMFSLLPDVDGIVFTFIETGSRIQNQYSKSLNEYEKMAMVVDTVASIVIDEMGEKMHIRTFVHDQWDRDVILGSRSLYRFI